MGEAGHVSARFRRVLDAGNFEAARLLAFELPRIALDDALALTLLAAEEKSERFQPMSRRWLARLAEEIAPDLRDFAIAAQLFADVVDGQLVPSKARDPLQRVADVGAAMGSSRALSQTSSSRAKVHRERARRPLKASRFSLLVKAG